jgi:hypothetical protein
MKKTISIDVQIPASVLAQVATDPQAWARFCWETYGRYVHQADKVSVKLSPSSK